MPTGRNIGGSVANSFAAGSVYNPWRGSYAPGGVTGTRLGLGAAQQFGGPVGSLAGWLANKIYSSTNGAAKAWDSQLATDNIIGPQRQAFNQQLLTDAANRQYVGPVGPADARFAMSGGIPQLNGISGATSGVPRFMFDTMADVDFTPTAHAPTQFRGANGQMVGAGGGTQYAGPAHNPSLGAMAGRASSGAPVNGVAFGVGKGGASVIQGQAAQDYFDSMKQSALAAQRQQGGDVYGHSYIV